MDLDNLTLYHGSHDSGEGKSCLMEAVSVYLNQSFSDSPEGVSKVLAAYGRTLNDLMPDEWRAKLVPLIPRIAACDSSLDQSRKYLAADWAVRECAPMALDACGHPERATTLRGLPKLVDRETCLAAAAAVSADYVDYAADYAAYDAAYAAAAYADYAAYDAYAAIWQSAIDLFVRMIEVSE